MYIIMYTMYSYSYNQAIIIYREIRVHVARLWSPPIICIPLAHAHTHTHTHTGRVVPVELVALVELVVVLVKL